MPRTAVDQLEAVFNWLKIKKEEHCTDDLTERKKRIVIHTPDSGGSVMYTKKDKQPRKCLYTKWTFFFKHDQNPFRPKSISNLKKKTVTKIW